MIAGVTFGFIGKLLDYTRRARVARRIYCVGTTLISCQRHARHNYSTKRRELVKWDIRNEFQACMICKMSETEWLFDSDCVLHSEITLRGCPELSVTDRRRTDRQTTDGRTWKLEGSLHNRPFGQLDYTFCKATWSRRDHYSNNSSLESVWHFNSKVFDCISEEKTKIHFLTRTHYWPYTQTERIVLERSDENKVFKFVTFVTFSEHWPLWTTCKSFQKRTSHTITTDRDYRPFCDYAPPLLGDFLKHFPKNSKICQITRAFYTTCFLRSLGIFWPHLGMVKITYCSKLLSRPPVMRRFISQKSVTKYENSGLHPKRLDGRWRQSVCLC